MYLNKRSSILVQTLLLVALLILYFTSFNSEQSKLCSATVLVLTLLSLFTFYVRKEPINRIKNQYIRITTIFIFSYVIVYFQLHIDYMLDYIKSTNVRFWVNPKIVPRSSYLSAIGLVSFFLGYELTNIKPTNKKSQRYIYSTMVLTLISVFLLFLTLITINPQYLFGGYGKYEMGNIARYSSILFELTASAIFIQKVINLNLSNRTDISLYRYVLSIGLFQWSIIGIYLLLVLISGDRGPIIYTLIGFVSSYVILTHWKISIFKIIILVFLASTFMTILSTIRSKDLNVSFAERLNIAFFKVHKPYKQLEGTKTILNPTLELATSVRCLHNTMNSVPADDGFYYGQFQLFKLVTIFPLGQKLIQNIFGIEEYKLTSEKYISYIIGGNSSGSEGTCCVADLYLDFGLIGVLFGLLLFGYFVRIIEVKSFSDNLPSLIVLSSYVVFCQYSIYIPRSAILVSVRNIIWLYLIILFARTISSRRLS